MRAEHPKSRVVGPAMQPDGACTVAYRALEALVCAQCGGAIDLGQFFSRHALLGSRHAMEALTKTPVCSVCRPLRMEGTTDG